LRNQVHSSGSLETLSFLENQSSFKMSHGGKREGAGRRKGPASPQRKITQSIVRKAAEHGDTPLEFLLSVMRDKNEDIDTRIDAAKAAANYMHAKKNETQVTGGMVINIGPLEASIA
jgi:hypothetical protein